MALEASTLSIKVQSMGVEEATKALNKLAEAGDKAEKSANKLSQTNKGQEASAKKQEALWYSLIDKASRYYERQWEIQQKALQRQNSAAEAAILREANAMNKAFDRRVAEEKASYEKLQRQADRYYAQQAADAERGYKKLQAQADKFYRNRDREAAAALKRETQAHVRAYAEMQAEAIKMNAAMDRIRRQDAANAAAAAERMAINNARFSAASSGSRVSIARQAMAYGANGGDVAARFGSEAAAVANAQGIARLSAEHERLQAAARRSRDAIHSGNSAMGEAHALARGLSGSLGALWMTYGNLAGMAVGVAIGAGMKNIITQGAAVEHVLQSIGVRSDESAASVQKLREMVYSLGTGVYGPLEVAKALETLILAGQSAGEAAKSVKDALNLATVGGTSIEKSAFTLVQVGTAMGYTAEGFSTVADVISKTAAVTMSSVESLSEAFKSASAVGKLYGVSLQDLATTLGALSQLGIQGSAAGTSVKNFYKELSAMTPKVEKTLGAMGVKLKDLQDSNGRFLDLLTVVKKLSAGFATLREDLRPQALQTLSNERGIKTAVELLDLYQKKIGETGNGLSELRNQIGEAGGYAAQGAARMALTAENQMKSVGNTLKQSFVEAFTSIEPQVVMFSRTLKSAFASAEFKESIQGVAVAIANVSLAIVTNLPLLANLAKALIAFKIATTIAAGFTALSTAVTSVGAAFTGVAAVTSRLAVALPALGVIVAGVAAAWALYAFFKEKAADDTMARAAKANSDELIENLRKENDRIAESNRLMRENIGFRKAMQIAAENATVAEVKATHDKGIADLQRQRQKKIDELTAQSNNRVTIGGLQLSPGKKDFSKDAAILELDNRIIEARKVKLKAVQDVQEQINRSRKEGDENAKGQMESIKREFEEQQKAFKGAIGTLPVTPDKDATAQINFIKQQRTELEKLIATYGAKNKAMEESFITGKKVMAETQESIVNVALAEGKYGKQGASNPAYSEAMRLAKLADELKLRNENNKQIEEFRTHLDQVIEGEKQFQIAAEDEANAFFGQQRRKAEGLIKNLSLSDAAAARLRVEADLVDQITRAEDARAKLRSTTDRTKQRAGEAEAEIESMLMFGTKTKATALEVARLAIEKAKLSSSADEGIKKALLEAAANEQSLEGYRAMIRQRLDMEEELKKAQADSLSMFSDNEVEKVRIAQDAAMRVAEVQLAAVQTANNEKFNAGTITVADILRFQDATEEFTRLKSVIEKVAQIKLNNLSLKKEINEWKTLGKAIESALTGAFGKAGEAAGKMFNLFAQGRANDIAYNKEAAALKESNYLSEVEKAKALEDLKYRANSDRLGEYAAMADAAKGFFDENSKGYQAMIRMSQVLHAAEVALSVVKGVNAVLTQGEGDPYTAFARMAAMTALVTGLGVAISGGGSGGMSSADQQRVQGTGSVLGSRTTIVNGKVELVGEKSESIKNSLSILEKNSGLGLVQDSAMLRAMQALSTGISALAAKVASQSGVTGDYAGTLAKTGTIGNILSKIPLVGGILGKIGTAIFGGKQTLDDTGFTASRGSLAQIMANGFNASQYANITTSGGWFSSDKHSTQTTSVGADVNAQFTRVIMQMATSIQEAAKVLGVSGDDFTAHLNSFVVDIGKISLKGMSGTEVEKALGHIFSKLGDDMAMFAFSSLQQYQKVGEGMLETVARLANDMLQVTDVFAVMGKTIPRTVEGIAEAERLIEKFGSADNLASKVGGYVNAIYTEGQKLDYITKNVRSVMASLNLSNVTTKEQFKNVVDKAFAEKDYELYQRLMDVASAFGQVADAAEKAAESSVSEARSALNDAYEREAQAIKDTQERMVGFVKTLKDLQKSTLLSDLSPLTPQQKYLEAKSQFEQIAQAAKNGDENAQGQFQSAYTAFLEASKLVNASGKQYQEDFMFAQRVTKEAAAWAEKQVDVAKASLNALNAQVAGLVTVNNTLLSVHDAIERLVALQGGTTGQTVAANNANAIDTLYTNLLGRHVDDAGKSYWLNAMANGYSLTDIAKLIGSSPEAMNSQQGSGSAPAIAAPVFIPVVQQSNNQEVAKALSDMAAGIEEVKQAIQTGATNTVGAIYDSQGSAADKTVDGISEALNARSNSGLYKIVER